VDCIDPLLSTLEQLSDSHTECVICWQHRPVHEDVASAFLAEAGRRGFVVTRDDPTLIPGELRAAAGNALQVVRLRRPTK